MSLISNSLLRNNYKNNISLIIYTIIVVDNKKYYMKELYF